MRAAEVGESIRTTAASSPTIWRTVNSEVFRVGRIHPKKLCSSCTSCGENPGTCNQSSAVRLEQQLSSEARTGESGVRLRPIATPPALVTEGSIAVSQTILSYLAPPVLPLTLLWPLHIRLSSFESLNSSSPTQLRTSRPKL